MSVSTDPVFSTWCCAGFTDMEIANLRDHGVRKEPKRPGNVEFAGLYSLKNNIARESNTWNRESEGKDLRTLERPGTQDQEKPPAASRASPKGHTGYSKEITGQGHLSLLVVCMMSPNTSLGATGSEHFPARSQYCFHPIHHSNVLVLPLEVWPLGHVWPQYKGLQYSTVFILYG